MPPEMATTRKAGADGAAANGGPGVPVAVLVIHGPNLNLLGQREPEIYGRATLKDLEKLIRTEARRLGFSTVFFQSAHEGALIDRIHALTDRGVDAFIVNFGAYLHTSIALHDALKASGLPPSRCTYRMSKNANHSARNP